MSVTNFINRLLFGVNCSKSARNEESSSRDALNSGLTSADSGLQLDLEIALSGVSAKVKPPKKSARPAKDFESCETVSIAESAQCSLVRGLAQLVNHESTRVNTNRCCNGGCVSRKSLNLATSYHADSSRGEFGFKAGRSAE